jgi:hypothetical protein
MTERHVREYDASLTRAIFLGECERRSAPAVVRGLAAAWSAVTRWDPQHGGLQHLRAKCGDALVSCMVSQSDVFVGAMADHQPAAGATPR